MHVQTFIKLMRALPPDVRAENIKLISHAISILSSDGAHLAAAPAPLSEASKPKHRRRAPRRPLDLGTRLNWN